MRLAYDHFHFPNIFSQYFLRKKLSSISIITTVKNSKSKEKIVKTNDVIIYITYDRYNFTIFSPYFSAKIVIYLKSNLFFKIRKKKKSSKRFLSMIRFNFPNFFTWNVDKLDTIFHNTLDLSTLLEVRNNDNSDNFVDLCHPERTHKFHTKCMSGQLEQYLRSKWSSWTTWSWSCLVEVTKATESKFFIFFWRQNCRRQFDMFFKEFLTLLFSRDFDLKIFDKIWRFLLRLSLQGC